MKELIAFLSEHVILITIIVGIACVLVGRIWSDRLNRGEITTPELIIKKGRHYKVVNLYIPDSWTEDWIVGSIVCLKRQSTGIPIPHNKLIYVSGDRIRFTDEGPVIGAVYEATATKKATGAIVMKLVPKKPARK